MKRKNERKKMIDRYLICVYQNEAPIWQKIIEEAIRESKPLRLKIIESLKEHQEKNNG